MMEALEAIATDAAPILLRENASEIARITNETLRRCDGLNRILRQGFSVDQLQSLRTKHAIEFFIDGKVMESNEMYRQLKQAGITAPVAIPAHLLNLSNDLHWWSQHGSLQFLAQDYSGNWAIDDDQLQGYFIATHLREYLPEHRRAEYEFLLSVCEYYRTEAAPNNQLTGKENSFWSSRIEPLRMHEFKPRPEWFLSKQ